MYGTVGGSLVWSVRCMWSPSNHPYAELLLVGPHAPLNPSLHVGCRISHSIPTCTTHRDSRLLNRRMHCTLRCTAHCALH